MPRGSETIAVAGDPVATGPRSNGMRPLQKRRSLPNGRAALGGLLVTAATVVLFSVAAARDNSPMERYVVADHALGLGTRIAAGDLRTTELHLPEGALRQRVFGDLTALIGSIVIAPVAEGELIQASAVVARNAAPDLRQISVPIEAARSLGDRLQPGELVDVLATFGTGADAFTVPVVRAARVVGRDSTGGPLGESKGQVIVLAVDNSPDAIAIAHAVAAGQVSLVRVSGTSPASGDEAPYRPPRPGQ